MPDVRNLVRTYLQAQRNVVYIEQELLKAKAALRTADHALAGAISEPTPVAIVMPDFNTVVQVTEDGCTAIEYVTVERFEATEDLSNEL